MSNSATAKKNKPSKNSEVSHVKTKPSHLSLVEDAAPQAYRRLWELLGVAVIGLAILLAMALLSYQPIDRAWADPSHSSNMVGPAGEISAELLFAALGFGAYLIATSVFVLGLMLLRSVKLRVGASQFAGLALILLGATTILHITLGAVEDIPFPPGGLLGVLLGDLLAGYFATAGAVVLASTVLALGLLITTELSPSLLMTAIVDAAQYIYQHFIDSIVLQKERARIRKEKRAERKKLAAELAAVAKVEAAEEAARRKAHKAEQKALRQQKVRDKASLLAKADLDKEQQRAAQAAALQELSTENITDIDLAVTDPGSPVFAEEADGDRDHSKLTAQLAKGKNASLLQLAEDFDVPVGDSVTEQIFVENGAQTNAVDDDNRHESNKRSALDDPPWVADFAASHKEQQQPVLSPTEAQPTFISGPPEQAQSEQAQPEHTPSEQKMQAQPDRSAKNTAKDSGPRIIEYKPKEKDPNKVDNDSKTTISTAYKLPDLHLLDYDAPEEVAVDELSLSLEARKLEKIFKDYGIEGQVREIRPGPVVTTYEYVPKAGTRIAKIASLADDLAMAMEAIRVRVVAPIPGKGAVGIEIPNVNRQSVFLKEIIAAKGFQRAKSKLAMAIGKDIEGRPVHMDLAKMPHMLIAGTTGSGKSVAINTLITSILYKASPEEVRFLMIDPKMLELSMYEGIPHLLLPPVTDPKKASAALYWAVSEMERRYQVLAESGVRDIKGYNKKMAALREQEQARDDDKDQLDAQDESTAKKAGEHMPYIVVVVDEFADLMMVASRDVESYIARLAQKARACGIHVLLATQRPSTDVITGVIKANFPVRMSFQVASQHDSKTIINAYGAEKLLGKGDMLLIPPGGGSPQRCHGAFVSEDELHKVVEYLKTQGEPAYDESILKSAEEDSKAGADEDAEYDEHFDAAVEFVSENQLVSISKIQRRFSIGYNRAAKIVERMEVDGMVGPQLPGNKPREVYLPRPQD